MLMISSALLGLVPTEEEIQTQGFVRVVRIFHTHFHKRKNRFSCHFQVSSLRRAHSLKELNMGIAVVTVNKGRLQQQQQQQQQQSVGCQMFEFSKMKIFLSTLFILLAVVSGEVCEEIKVRVTEHKTAVIPCPYAKGYEDYPKYFCKGIYKDCANLIRSNGKDMWTYEGRFSLADDTEKKKVVAYMANLSMEDAGPYGCGIETKWRDPFTVVYLTVIKAPNPPKIHQSPVMISTYKPQITKLPKIHQPTTSTTFPTHSSKGHSLAVTNRTESTPEDTGNSTLPPRSDHFIIVGGTIGGVLLSLAVMSVISFALRRKAGKKEGQVTGHVNSQVNREYVCFYEEIQSTNPTEGNTSISTHQCPASHSGNTTSSDQSEPHPALITIYSTITNLKHISHAEYTLATNPVPLTGCSASPSMEVHSQSAHNSNELTYSKIYFLDNKASNPLVGCNNTTYSTVQNILQNESVTYSMITDPKISAERISDYSTVGFPQN
ncbi:uncharacterized protein [Salminus brasiliensis]|uniref:uncharacterized protein n=1 Tax=Salminus brasiliensis TaxID=930266 RepID=UPI003B832330